MKPIIWFCTVMMTVLTAAILYWCGISPFSVLVVLVPLAYPVWVIWMSLYLSR